MFDAEPRAADRPPAPAPYRSGRPGVSDYLLAMSQELRAPLNAVIGMSGLLLDGDLAGRQRQYVRSIHAAGESLSSTLNDLLDLARIQAGRLLLEPIAFDLQSMVDETVGVLSARAAERGLTLRVDWRPEVTRHVIGDPGRTRQVLGNLVSQAMNGTSQGEVIIRVAPDGDRDGASLVRFSVEDTGIGLPADRLERVFDEYVPVDASPYRSFGVTGLGLRISAELVQLMGGEIGAESEMGQGSRFWFRLPMPAAEGATGLVLGEETPPGGGRILFVEGDQASRARFSAQVAEDGWHADFADDLAQVEEQLRAAHRAGDPYRACVFSDYAVRPSHADLARRLKADERLAPVALVIVTAVGSPGEGRRLWHAGFAAYLRKPVPTDELRAALAALEAAGPDGRGPALITRHSLAEARSAQAKAEFDGFREIDAVLASLTATVAREALVIGVGGADQLELTEALAQAGLAATPAAAVAEALGTNAAAPELVLIDADRQGQDVAGEIARLRARHGQVGRLKVVALTVDVTRRDELLAAGADAMMARPVRRGDLGRILKELEAAGAPPEPDAAPGDEPPIPVAGAGVEHEPQDTPLDQVAVADLPPDLSAAPDLPLPDLPLADLPLADLALTVAPETSASDGEHDSDPAPAPTEAAAPLPDDVPAAEPLEDPWEEPTVPEDAVALEPAPEAIEAEWPGAPEPEAGHAIEEAPVPVVALALFAGPAPLAALPALHPPAQVAATVAELAPAAVELELTLELPPDEPAGPGLAPPDDLIRMEVGQEHDASPLDGFVANDLANFDLEPAVEAWSEPAPAGPEAVSNADMDHHGAAFDQALDLAGSGDDLEVPESEPEAAPAPADRLDEPGEFPSAPLIELELAGEPESYAGLATPAAAEVPVPTAADGPRPEAAPAAGADPYGDLPVVGASILEQLASPAGSFAQHLAASFLRDAPIRIEELAAASAAGDPLRAQQAARALRAMAGLLGAERLAAACADADTAASAGPAGLAARAHAVERAFAEVRTQVELVAARTAPAELPAVAPSFLDQLASGRDGSARSLALKLAASFQSEAPGRLAELTQAIAREDAETVQRIAPGLKGMCGLIGADPLAKLCALAEADARLRRVGAARRYVGQMTLELGRVVEALRQAAS